MVWTYAQLKAADAALGVADLTAAADALAAQTVTLTVPAASVSVAVVHGILLLAQTGDWLLIESRAAETFSAGFPSSPAANDAAIAAARLAVTLAASKVDSIAPEAWADFLAQLDVLHTANVVAQATRDAIAALGSLTASRFQPAPTAGDVQTARAMP
jgi:hypothetical protein